MKIRIYNKESLSFFPLYPVTADINFPQDDISRPAGYETHQIFLISDGAGVLNIDGKTFILNKNDFFYIAANTPHEYYRTDGNFSTTYLSFFCNDFDNIKKYYKLGDYAIYKNKNRGKFNANISKLFELFDTVNELSTLCSLAFSTVIDFFDEACKKEYSSIENVYNYIELNYSKAIALDDILELYPYSKAKLCRDFKDAYNSTIFEMLTKIRLEHAQYMIYDNPHIKLKTVASACGFNDVSYFCKMYKHYFGCRPKS